MNQAKHLLHKNRLRLSIRFQAISAQLPSKAGLLRPSKWHLIMQHSHAVNTHGAALQARANPHRPIDVFREHCRVEPIFGIIRHLQKVFLVFERAHARHRPEDLVLVHGRLRVRVVQHRRLEEVARLTMPLAPCQDLRLARILSEERLNARELRLISQRPELGIFVTGVADARRRLLDVLDERGHELLRDAFLHVDAACGDADLPRVICDGSRGPLHCIVEIAVVEDPGGCLPAELERHSLQVAFCGGALDLFAGQAGAGEADFADVRVSCEELAGGSGAVEDLQDSWGKDVCEERGEAESGERALLTRFENDDVAGG